MEHSDDNETYEIYSVTFSLDIPDLYFYYFRITTKNERFSLYKEGYDKTNIEVGELWQLSCIPKDFKIPKSFFGAVMYQIFPDRFNQTGVCDTSEKLRPFWIHEDKRDIPCYLPSADGVIENCDFYGGNLRGITEKLDYIKKILFLSARSAREDYVKADKRIEELESKPIKRYDTFVTAFITALCSGVAGYLLSLILH
jgi:hypothetical protein